MEKQQILVDWNNTLRIIRKKNVYLIIRRTSAAIPDSPAVPFGEKQLNLSELILSQPVASSLRKCRRWP